MKKLNTKSSIALVSLLFANDGGYAQSNWQIPPSMIPPVWKFDHQSAPQTTDCVAGIVKGTFHPWTGDPTWINFKPPPESAKSQGYCVSSAVFKLAAHKPKDPAVFGTDLYCPAGQFVLENVGDSLCTQPVLTADNFEKLTARVDALEHQLAETLKKLDTAQTDLSALQYELKILQAQSGRAH